MVNPILVALDLPDSRSALAMARKLSEHVGGFKVGLELLMSEGAAVVASVASIGLPVFADAKLHDIPNTVQKAASELGSRGARWVTAHASGGGEMIEAAREGLLEGSGGEPCGVLGVTVLTSLDETDLEAVGVVADIGAQVQRLAVLAASRGAEGVVCSPHEAKKVKSVAPGILAFTPGIRPVSSTSGDDQKRVSSPIAALREGANYLVIGRPITRASDPVAAAAEIARDIVRAG